MPLLYIDVIEGRDPGEIKALLDTAHLAVVKAFDVPERDRYQVVKSHPAGEIVAGAPVRRRRGSTRCWPSDCETTAVSTRLI
jgi:hypothetical protein